MDRHISWENFRDNFVAPGVPAVHDVAGDPATHFAVGNGGRTICVRVAIDKATSSFASALAEVDINTRAVQGNIFVEVSTSRKDLFQPFYGVMILIADLVQLERVNVKDAVPQSIHQLRALLRPVGRMTEPAALGLWGELWVLKRLVKAIGAEALDLWVGPRGEAHDFRKGASELEVKTTRSERREHIINGLMQLLPSPNCQLHVLSLQVKLGEGQGAAKLPEIIKDIRSYLQGTGDLLQRFNNWIDGLGWRDEHAGLYTEQWSLRSTPAAFEVKEGFPRIVPSVLAASLDDGVLNRINEVHYRVNMTGLPETTACGDFSVLIGR